MSSPPSKLSFLNSALCGLWVYSYAALLVVFGLLRKMETRPVRATK
jgi:hypothetical protein